MDKIWGNQFRSRLRVFSGDRSGNGSTVSIKIRVTAGCFHSEHSPQAYRLICAHLSNRPLTDIEFVEHESGPELLVWLAVGIAGITLMRSVMDLVTVILKTRSEGIAKGDQPSAPLELILGRELKDGKVCEKRVLHIRHHDRIDEKLIEEVLNRAARDLFSHERQRQDQDHKKDSRENLQCPELVLAHRSEG